MNTTTITTTDLRAGGAAGDNRAAPVLEPAAKRPRGTSAARLAVPGIIRSEWIKLLSLRSTWWTLTITAIMMVLLSLAQSSAVDLILEDTGGALVPHGAEFVTAGYQLGMVTIAVLGALLMTAEYSSGTISATLAAVPARAPVLAAKALALITMTVAVSAVSIIGAYLVAAPLLTDQDLVPGLGDPLTWQVFGGTTFFFVAAGLMALGIGALLRHTAGAITAALGLLLVLPGALQFVPFDWVQDAVSLMPLPAAISFLGVSDVFGTNELLSTWQGVAVVGGYAVLALTAGAISLRRRDA